MCWNVFWLWDWLEKVESKVQWWLTWEQALDLVCWVQTNIESVFSNATNMVRLESLIYRIISWEHAWRPCVIRNIHGKWESENEVGIYFADTEKEEFIFVDKNLLEQIEIPWWKMDKEHYYRPTETLEKYLARWGWYPNRIRDKYISHPEVIKKWDTLANWEFVLEDPRFWFNSSILLRLSTSWWVELAPRLPIALCWNTNYKLAQDLAVWDVLATWCRVVEWPFLWEPYFVYVALDKKTTKIDIPYCVPIALG